MAGIAPFDTVALLKDVPEWGLVRGQVGAVVDVLGEEAVLVEFADPDGRTIALPGGSPRGPPASERRAAAGGRVVLRRVRGDDTG